MASTRLELDQLLVQIGQVGKRLSDIGAAEGAAGNLSVCFRENVELSSTFPQVQPIHLPGPAPDLAGATVIVSGSGRRLRDILDSKKPTDAELKFAKDSIAIALPGNNETSDEIANSYGEILTFGLKDTYWNDFVGDITSLTTADINKSAGRLIHPEALTWVVVGDLSKIEAKVRALNFGEVAVIDVEGNVVAR